MKLFSGSSNTRLTNYIARWLDIHVGKAHVGRFSDGETRVEIEECVRGENCFVIQSIATPANDNLMELLVMIDSLRWASAGSITAVVPYMGYARQDRKPRSLRVPQTARFVAKMIAEAGAHRMLTVDLHADQIQGFFDIPTDNLYASPVMLADIWKQQYEEVVVVSPDVGGVVRARALAKRLENAGLAIIDKRRPEPNQSEVMNIIGSVEGKRCIIIDDLVDTAGTLCHGAKALKEHGAKKVVAYCTHPVLSGEAVATIQASQLDELVVTNTIPLRQDAWDCPRIRQVYVDELLAETIRRVGTNESVSSMFMD